MKSHWKRAGSLQKSPARDELEVGSGPLGTKGPRKQNSKTYLKIEPTGTVKLDYRPGKRE